MFFAVITIIKLYRMGLTKRLVAIFAYAIRQLIVSLQSVNYALGFVFKRLVVIFHQNFS